MSFSSGVFSINSSGQPVVTGTTISSTVFNAFTADIATGLSTCILKDGTQTLTANIPFGGFKITGLGAGIAAGNSLRYEQLFSTSPVQLLGAMDWFKGADIASASTVNLTTATGNGVHITGTVTITAITLGSGMWRLVIFDGILTLTHHATNNNLPGGANITTAAGDRALYWSDGTTVYCSAYQRASGGIIASATQTEQETSTSLTVPVTPGVQQYHPSAAKAWVSCNNAGAAESSYNVTSVTDTNTGIATVNLTVSFSGTTYTVIAQTDGAGGGVTCYCTSRATGSFVLSSFNTLSQVAQDSNRNFAVAFGDQ